MAPPSPSSSATSRRRSKAPPAAAARRSSEPHRRADRKRRQQLRRDVQVSLTVEQAHQPDGAPPTEPRRRQLRMLRPTLDDLPPLAVPAGYRLRTFQPGDEP